MPQKAYLGKGTLAEILSYPRAINPNADYAAVLHDIGLPKYTEQLHETNINWAQTLSAGEQQRIAIARALLAAPDYLYLDENTSALELVNRTTFVATTQKPLAKQHSCDCEATKAN